MTKSDLKSGMLVQLRIGTVKLVMDNVLLGSITSLTLDDYNEDLTTKGAYPELDIVKVSKVLPINLLSTYFWNKTILKDYLLWEKRKH